jgi:hypothetical protein
MFGQKKDRKVVELTIVFNLSAISKWLDTNSEIEDIEKLEKDWDGDAVKLSYYIDVLPNGQSGDMYYHRKKGIISGNVSGIDFLENVDQSLKSFLKDNKIHVLAWKPWRQFMRLDVNNKPILLVPIEEIVELQINRLKNGGSVRDEEKKIKVPILFNEQNNPKKFIEIWRGSPSDLSVGFHNALAWVSASSLNFEVEY